MVVQVDWVHKMILISTGCCYGPGWSNYTGNDLMKEVEEKRELAQKVKDLEFRLANQKEKYDDMKQDLRDAKERAQKAEWRLMKGKCILM